MRGTVHGERIFGLSHQPHFVQRYSLFLGQCPCLCLIKFSNEGGRWWLCIHVPPTAQAMAFAELMHNRFVSVEITVKLRDVKLHLTWWVLSPRCATLYLSVPRLFVLFALERPAMHFVDALYRWVGGRTISLDHNTRATILVAARRIFYRNNTWHEMSLYFGWRTMRRMTDDAEVDILATNNLKSTWTLPPERTPLELAHFIAFTSSAEPKVREQRMSFYLSRKIIILRCNLFSLFFCFFSTMYLIAIFIYLCWSCKGMLPSAIPPVLSNCFSFLPRTL